MATEELRVLVVHNRYRSGQPSGENAVVDDEVALLRDSGVDTQTFQVESDEIAERSLPHRLSLPAEVVWSRRGVRSVREAISESGANVVHFHNTFPLLSPASLRAARSAGVAVVQTLHNFRPLCSNAMLLRNGRICEDCLPNRVFPGVQHGCYRGSRLATVPVAAMIRTHRFLRTWESVDVFIAPAEFAKSRFVKAGWPDSAFVVKANTAPDPKLPLSKHRSGFVCLSRLSREKGIDTLLDAWGRVGGEIGEPLTIAGAGELEGEIRRKASTLANVRFVGQLSREQTYELLAVSRALVVPSRWYEVFPRTIVEAYACGAAVIASDVGGLHDLVVDEVTGLRFALDDSTQLGHAVRRVASDSELATKLGRGARTMYDDRYNERATTRLLIAAYELALRRRRQSGSHPFRGSRVTAERSGKADV